jgi:hypothetical protein
MMFEIINTIAQILAAAGVLAGLVFVGIQIRHNTRAVRVGNFHAITDSFNTTNLTIGASTSTARVLRLGFAGIRNLTEDERVQFSFIALSAFRIMETLYYSSKIGVAEQDLWFTERKTIDALVRNPGMREWWATNPLSFTPEFRALVDQIIKEIDAAAPSPVTSPTVRAIPLD